jgi:hypothetical protein
MITVVEILNNGNILGSHDQYDALDRIAWIVALFTHTCDEHGKIAACGSSPILSLILPCIIYIVELHRTTQMQDKAMSQGYGVPAICVLEMGMITS